MKMPKDKIKLWIDELRSGKWAQTREVLKDYKGWCCLGLLVETQLKGYPFRICNMDVPNTDHGAEKWMEVINNDFAYRIGSSLVALNDSGYGLENLPPFTFDEIADLLQAVYIEEVLS